MQLNTKKIFAKIILILIMTIGISSANALTASGFIKKLDFNAAKEYVGELLDEAKQSLEEYAQAHPDANVNFRLSCNGDGGVCVRTYRNTQVQMLQAQQIAIEHIKMNKGYDIHCSMNYRTESNDDYIKCTDYKGHFYEFQFDDIKESFDDTIKYSVASSMCRLYNGTVQIPEICDIKKDHADKFRMSLQKFGYDADCHQTYPQHPDKRCEVNFISRRGKLRTAYNIINDKFKHLHVRSNADLIFLLKRYAQRMVKESGKTFDSNDFKCNNSFNTYYTDSFTNPKNDILTCYVNGKPVDFLFDDVNEALDYEANSGTAGLTCIADAGGTFDGKSCNGITKDQCIRLGRKVPGGVTWDNTLDTCMLKDASKAQAINDAISDIVAVGTAVATLIITVTTAGTGTVGIIAVYGATATTAGTVMAVNVQHSKEEEIREIMSRIMGCNDTACAQVLFNEFLNEHVQYIDDLDEQLLSATDDMTAHLIELLLNEQNSKKDFMNMIDNALAESNNIANIANWAPLEIAGFTAKIFQAVGSALSLGSAITADKGQSFIELLKENSLSKTFNAFKEVVDEISDAYETYDNIEVAVTALSAAN